jgi:MFS family permease
MKQFYKYFTLLFLYLAQSIPMSFFSTVVPVIMRQEQYSLASIGLIQLVKLPWIFKFLWAPLVDKSAVNLKQYRKWIFVSELFYAAIIIGIGFFNLESSFATIIALMVVAFIASATQDIATDAFAAIVLKPSERSLGNSMQSAGTFLGTLVGSGVLLILYYFLGWQWLLVFLAGFVLLAILPLMFGRKLVMQPSGKETKKVKMTDVFTFFAQKGSLRRVFILVLYYSGIIGVLTMIKPFFVDMGYDVKQIGFISGVFGTSIGATCALLAGFVIKWAGRKASFHIFSGFGLLSAVYFFWVASGNHNLSWLYLGVGLLWGAYGMMSVIIYTTSMDIVRKGREGTDFTIQIVLTHLSSLLIAVGSGKLADIIEYKGLFFIEIILGIISFILLFVLYKKEDEKNAITTRIIEKI